MGAVSSSVARRPAGNLLGRLLLVLWLVVAAALLAPGFGYYRADAGARAYSAERELYAPTGVVGHSLGYTGALMIVVGVAGYVARKRWRRLAEVGRLPDWLQVHIFLCTMGPYLILLHTSFKFGGVAAISFWSMAAAVGSGILGRYIYAHIPRTIHGHLRTLDALQESAVGVKSALGDVARETRLALEPLLARPEAPPRSLAGALRYAAAADWRSRTMSRQARRLLQNDPMSPYERKRLLSLVGERMRLEQQIALLAPFQRLFNYWHVLHVPVALLMLLTLALHVTLAVAFGYGWPF
jgi:hypothetical protein